jgi:hypothetical protein
MTPALPKTRSGLRTGFGILFLFLTLVIWIPADDVIDLIVRSHPIVLGRYSMGHFGVLFFLTLILLGLSALCFSRIPTLREMLQVALMVVVSTIASGFLLVVGSGIAVHPRYVEKVASTEEEGQKISGLVRERPPHEVFHLTQTDEPEQKRAYPDAPPGYPAYELTLTTDAYGFRNLDVHEQYPMLAVGDSFVAGSNVSDDQPWAALLSKKLHTDIYNLGVPGTDPGIYLNNFVVSGRKFKPKQVLFMIYEGNDFRDITAPVLDLTQPAAVPQPHAEDVQNAAQAVQDDSLSRRITLWTKASPVTRGLQRLSTEMLEKIGRDNPVPGYAEKVGFMPVKITSPDGKSQYYAFEPKRMLSLVEDKETFRTSVAWQQIRRIMQTMVMLGEKEGFDVLFLYAPSTPHVVMPLARDAIPEEQLHRFAAYQEKHLPSPHEFKQQVFDSLDNEQQVFLDECAASHLQCLSMTQALRDAAAQGKQVYFTYDQHWTPDGNRVVADALYQWFSENPVERH